MGSFDEDEDLDDEDGSEVDEDEDDDEDEDEDDGEEEEEIIEKPAKKAKLNGKEEMPVKSSKKEQLTKSAKTEEPTKLPKKEEAKKTKQEAKTEDEPAPKERFEDRAAAVGPLTEEERKMYVESLLLPFLTEV